jgi:hypothetical protein
MMAKKATAAASPQRLLPRLIRFRRRPRPALKLKKTKFHG